MHNDHKPLEAFFKKKLSSAPPRLQRMRLQKYDITLVYKQGRLMVLADTLSRAYPVGSEEELEEDKMILHVHMIQRNIADQLLDVVRQKTSADTDLLKLRRYIMEGWPHKSQLPTQLLAYWSYREELHIVDDLLLKGERIIILLEMRRDILQRLHKAHLGILKTKERARDTVFWPGITKDIEEIAHVSCIRNRIQDKK